MSKRSAKTKKEYDAGPGKKGWDRPVDQDRFDKNFDDIDWPSQRGKKK